MKFLGQEMRITLKDILVVFATFVILAVISGIIEISIGLLTGWDGKEPIDPSVLIFWVVFGTFASPIFAYVLLKLADIAKIKDYRSLAASYFVLGLLLNILTYLSSKVMFPYLYPSPIAEITLLVWIGNGVITAVTLYLWLVIFGEWNMKKISKTGGTAIISALVILLAAYAIRIPFYIGLGAIPNLITIDNAIALISYFNLSFALIYNMPKKLAEFQYFFAAVFIITAIIGAVLTNPNIDGLLDIVHAAIILGVIYLLSTNKNLTT